jgi:hypothetical protein
MIIKDEINNPIPQDGGKARIRTVKMIRIMYNGQPWFCKACNSYHNTRFCPDDDRDQRPAFNRDTSEPERKHTTLLLSASETKLFDPTTTDVKIVRWPGGRIGHIANMVTDEEMEDFEHLILVCGINDISMDTRETKEASKFHILKLHEALKQTKPKRISIFGPYVCPEQANYQDARRIINARLKRMSRSLQEDGMKVDFHAIPDNLM